MSYLTQHKVCKCGRGYYSRFDGKCGHCRTKAERRLHEYWVYCSSPNVTSDVPTWEWPRPVQPDRDAGRAALAEKEG